MIYIGCWVQGGWFTCGLLCCFLLSIRYSWAFYTTRKNYIGGAKQNGASVWCQHLVDDLDPRIDKPPQIPLGCCRGNIWVKIVLKMHTCNNNNAQNTSATVLVFEKIP